MRGLLRTGAAGIIVLGLVSLCPGEWPSIDFYADGLIEDGNTFAAVRLFNDATVDMTGGTVQSYLELYGTSTFNAYGGSMGISSRITLFDRGIINLRELEGGSTYGVPHTSIDVAGGAEGQINFYGYGFFFEGNRLHGYWADGSPFAFIIRSNAETQAALVFHEVPEPASLGILTLGAAVAQQLKRRLRR